jgi:hypothetical protein
MNSMRPQSLPVDMISYGFIHNFAPSFLKIWLHKVINYIANSSYRKSSPDLTINLIRSHVFKSPYLEHALILSLYSKAISLNKKFFLPTISSVLMLIQSFPLKVVWWLRPSLFSIDNADRSPDSRSRLGFYLFFFLDFS